MIFDFALIADSIPKMLAGFWMTFELWFLSAVLGLALAIILLLMRISGRWYLYAPAMAYILYLSGHPNTGADIHHLSRLPTVRVYS